MINTQKNASDREFHFTDGHFQFLSSLANSHTGIVLAENKRDMVYSRLARRLRALELNDFGQYCEFLQTEEGKSEIIQLVNAVTTNLTSFFRESHHFDHLRETVIIPHMREGKDKKLRIWSSACSAGMEPYSIAITMRETIPDIDKWDAKILATDIDSNILATGIKGEYQIRELAGIPHNYKRHVHGGVTSFQVSDKLKELISFRQLNLLGAWPMKGSFDAIFCRNVVIYFDKPTKEALFERMANIIKPGGWLYIGHSENLHNISDRFELVGRTIYRRVK